MQLASETETHQLFNKMKFLIRHLKQTFFQSPLDSEDYGADFYRNPVFDPIKISESGGQGNSVEEPKYTNPYAVMYDSLFKKPSTPAAAPPRSKKKSSKDTYKYVDIEQEKPPRVPYNGYQEPYSPPSYDYPSGYDYSPPSNDYYSPPTNDYTPDVYSPPNEYAPQNNYETQNDYSPPSYEAPYEPEPYYPSEPVGPVLLEKRPYEVKSVQPLPITVSESYTSFDCRDKHPGRHYADPEAGCQVYHFCHHDGKQDTFHCGYGTVFNEYIGTCDYKNNVLCTAGQGYLPDPNHDQYHPEPHQNQYQPQEQYHNHEYQYKHQTRTRVQKRPSKPLNSFDEDPRDFFGGSSQDIKPFTNFGPF